MSFAWETRLRDRWSAGQAAVGVTVPWAAPELVELCGLLSFDFVLIDQEHGALTTADTVSLVRAAQVSGVTPLVRVSWNHPAEILRAMDSGAAGVMVPGIETVQAAEQAVRAAKYAPDGDRGLAAARASGWGLGLPLNEFVRMANLETVVVLLVESAAGVACAAEMARLPGVDAIFLGPADLSQSLGYPGEVNHPEVVRALERGIAAVTGSGKVAGINAPTGPQASRWHQDHGVRMIATGLPGLLAAGGRAYLSGAAQSEGR
jgi:2-keto-3-deoxy-L-rhamnonate aldolase RhmA